MEENILGAGAPNEGRRKGDVFKSHFHVANIVNEPSGAERKNSIWNILSSF
ncbi:MAG: hypothetical protein WC209_02785 [Ignavibacteriaceae bacterium]|jgi:hypothetical protein